MIKEQDEGALTQLALDLGEEFEPGSESAGNGGAEDGGGWADEVEARRRSELARLRLEAPPYPPISGEIGGNKDNRKEYAAWIEGYNTLRQMGFGWRVAAYIAWAASPRKGRKPERLEDFAIEVLGLTSARAIFVWRRKNPAIDEAVGMLRAAPLFEHRADVYQALIAMATTADYKGHNDRKLFLELVGDIRSENAGPQINLTVNDFRGMSTEELMRIAGQRRPPPLSPPISNEMEGEGAEERRAPSLPPPSLRDGGGEKQGGGDDEEEGEI